ncbi:MAG: alpha/beta hydrolase family protein [Kiritimatiellia bacterium]|jgi:pimeloyl-ACP methyl ester carboxylesterase
MTPLEKQIAQKHPILVSDTWGGGHRVIFDFEGRKGWVIEPGTPRADRPWCWTLQWMGAFLDRTGAPDLVRKGYHHVHLDAFDTRADDAGIAALASFQRYLVDELGFAAKANLIGMSWGGFYSIRYAAAHPDNVAAIYLDAPLLCLMPTVKEIGPWQNEAPADGDWSADPRMPINLADKVAAAKIPILLLYGGMDSLVPPAANAEVFVPRFEAAGGDIQVVNRAAYGHHPHGVELDETSIITDFFDKPSKPKIRDS